MYVYKTTTATNVAVVVYNPRATITERNAARKARNDAVIASYDTFVQNVAAIDLRLTGADGVMRAFEISRHGMKRMQFVSRVASFLYLLVVNGKIREKNAKRAAERHQPHPPEADAVGAVGDEFTHVRYGKKRYPTDTRQGEMTAYVEDIMNGLFWIDTRGPSTAHRKQERQNALVEAVYSVHAACDPFKNEKYDALMALIDAECAPILQRV